MMKINYKTERKLQEKILNHLHYNSGEKIFLERGVLFSSAFMSVLSFCMKKYGRKKIKEICEPGDDISRLFLAEYICKYFKSRIKALTEKEFLDLLEDNVENNCNKEKVKIEN